jgi:predicted phosphohydrolase
MKKPPKDAIPVGKRQEDQQEIKSEGTFCDTRKDEIMRRDAARIQRKAANAITANAHTQEALSHYSGSKQKTKPSQTCSILSFFILGGYCRFYIQKTCEQQPLP